MWAVEDIPRKLSVDDKHPISRHIDVFIDGVRQKGVISYDMDDGVLVRYVIDDSGYYVLNLERDEAERETIRGEVIVELRSE